MTYSISCKELGRDCPFMAAAETGENAIESLMHHLHTEHDEDWFEVEECYQAACAIVRTKAA